MLVKSTYSLPTKIFFKSEIHIQYWGGNHFIKCLNTWHLASSSQINHWSQREMCWDQRTLELTLVLGILTSKNDFDYKTHMNRVLLFRPHILGEKKASVYINIETSDSGAGEEMPIASGCPCFMSWPAIILFSGCTLPIRSSLTCKDM